MLCVFLRPFEPNHLYRSKYRVYSRRERPVERQILEGDFIYDCIVEVVAKQRKVRQAGEKFRAKNALLSITSRKDAVVRTDTFRECCAAVCQTASSG